MYEGPGIYRNNNNNYIWITNDGFTRLYLRILPLVDKQHSISIFAFTSLNCTLYLPSEGRTLEQMLNDHPELLL